MANNGQNPDIVDSLHPPYAGLLDGGNLNMIALRMLIQRLKSIPSLDDWLNISSVLNVKRTSHKRESK